MKALRRAAGQDSRYQSSSSWKSGWRAITKPALVDVFWLWVTDENLSFDGLVRDVFAVAARNVELWLKFSTDS